MSSWRTEGYKPPKRPKAVSKPKTSWWQDAARENFTATAARETAVDYETLSGVTLQPAQKQGTL